jgi:hypothetical protein
MLSEQQASQIVEDCIRAISHVGGVSFTGTLDDAEISDGTRVNNMITLIVNSKKIGVPSESQRIDAGWFLGVSPSTVVDEVVGIVMSKSIPVSGNALEDFAAMVAKHLAPHIEPTKRAVKKAAKKATKKGAAKSSKKSGSKGGKANK